MTPRVLDGLLRTLPDDVVCTNEGPDTWSPFDVVGHLIHGERKDWRERIGIILEKGETRPFTPFDRFAQFKESEGKSMGDLLDEFARLRGGSIEWLKSLNLTTADLDRTGMHPSLGRVTLRNLISTWPTHDLTHIAQVCRVLAKRYKHEIGPWLEYMRLVQG
jgi:hypothetical protein